MATLQLSDARSDGTVLGQTTTDKIGFYGNATPVVQPSGFAQTAITRGSAGGLVATFAHVASPASVATLTSAELGMTLVGGSGAAVTIATTDLVAVVTKPTSQAGLGTGNIRVSSAGVIGVEFVNLSAGFLTPTATQTYGTVALRGLGAISAVLTPASVASNTTAEQLFTVTGIRAGELISINKPTSQPGLAIAGVRAAAANQIGITFMNATAGPLTPTTSQTYTVISLGGLDATNNDVMFQISGAAQASLATLTTAQSTLTIGNLGVTDIVTGIQKPTNQAGLLASGGFVSAAGVAAVTFANVTASFLTPTANEVYGVKIWRAAPVAPLKIYSQALTPVAVAANTTAEQGFTVTGLISSTPVWVNKPSTQAGLGILGCRVSATDTLAITFANCTSTTITPTAAETYLVGNFQMPIDTGGNSILQSANLFSLQNSLLNNATRSAVVSTGLMAGA